MKKKKQRSKSKKRNPKSTKQDNKHVPMDKHRLEFENFLDDMTRWFSDHQLQIDQLFGCSDDTSRSVNLKDLELGLMNMGVPCQQFQLHVLTQLLKNSDNTISYQDFSRQVQSLRNNTELCAQISEDFLTGRAAAETENTSCLDSRQKPLNPENQSRFIRLSVRLIHLDSVAAHPGNFEVVLLSSSRVFSLIDLIQDRIEIQTSRLEVFRSRVPTEEASLPLENSLEECGFKGGPKESPPEATVYYDYILLLTDCPILNCDHYFRSKLDSAANRAGLCL